MLRTVLPERSQLSGSDTTPLFLQPLLSVFERRRGVHTTIVRIVQGLGFEDFLYGASASAKLDQEQELRLHDSVSRMGRALTIAMLISKSIQGLVAHYAVRYRWSGNTTLRMAKVRRWAHFSMIPLRMVSEAESSLACMHLAESASLLH